MASQFLQFMNNSLDGRSSSMVSFLSKRARLMISFSIELLGEYLKILNRPGIEDSVDVNEFLDDISANLENFKLREKEIREKHFRYSEESQIIDSQMVNSEMFSPDDISQLHAVAYSHTDSESVLQQAVGSRVDPRSEDSHQQSGKTNTKRQICRQTQISCSCAPQPNSNPSELRGPTDKDSDIRYIGT